MPMSYYKLTDGHTIVGVISNSDFRKYKPKTGMCVYANINDAQFAEYNNKYYKDDWLRPLTDCPIEITSIGIVHIEKEEYDNLESQFSEGGFVEDGSLDEIIEPVNEEQTENPQEVVQKTAAQILSDRIKLAARFAEV